MIVYGDRACRVAAESALAGVRELWRASEAGADLTPLLIACGKVAQGLLDSKLERTGSDELTPLARRATELVEAAGRLWLERGGLARERLAQVLCSLERPRVERDLTLKEPEGYAYYAVYPELYVEAARRLAHPYRHVQVLGIRSIGTSLAAVVAAAMESDRLPVTVRPLGHPFARRLSLGALLTAELLRAREDTLYVVADEGPGLSGSSFLAVYTWLTEQGVSAAQVRFLPSHDGAPGAAAGEANVARYLRVARQTVSFEELFSRAPSRTSRLARAFAPVLGEPLSDLRDLGGGRWRELVFARPESYPASHVQQERRKYLYLAASGSWLLKFAGLSDSSAYRARAQALAEAGFCLPLRAIRAGFAAQGWLSDAAPLSTASYPRADLIRQVARYLAFRARTFPAAAQAGATPGELFHMARHNTTQLLGEQARSHLDCHKAALPELARLHRPVVTDNKLDAHEWLLASDGRLVKSDALDHAAAHDLIGCQDLSWDVAGACVELAFDEGERAELLTWLAREGFSFAPAQLAFMELCYLAFRAGHAVMARSALERSCVEEAARLGALGARYTERLARVLALK